MKFFKFNYLFGVILIVTSSFFILNRGRKILSPPLKKNIPIPAKETPSPKAIEAPIKNHKTQAKLLIYEALTNKAESSKKLKEYFSGLKNPHEQLSEFKTVMEYLKKEEYYPYRALFIYTIADTFSDKKYLQNMIMKEVENLNIQNRVENYMTMSSLFNSFLKTGQNELVVQGALKIIGLQKNKGARILMFKELRNRFPQRFSKTPAEDIDPLNQNY